MRVRPRSASAAGAPGVASMARRSRPSRFSASPSEALVPNAARWSSAVRRWNAAIAVRSAAGAPCPSGTAWKVCSPAGVSRPFCRSESATL